MNASGTGTSAVLVSRAGELLSVVDGAKEEVAGEGTGSSVSFPVHPLTRARQVEQRGLGSAIANSMRAEAKDATGVRKLFNVVALRSGFQILWGFLQAVIAVALVMVTDWGQTRLPFWVIVVVAALWGVDALTNLWVGGRRLAKARQPRG